MDTKMKTPWPSAYTRQTDVSWTARHARPVTGDFHEAALPQMQAEWDAGEALRQKTAKRVDAITAEREADERAAAASRAAREQERNQKKLDALTAQLRRGYMASPGATEADFEKALPDLLEAQRREAALTGQDAARKQMATLYRNF